MLVEGNPAPAFQAKDQRGKSHALADYAGRYVVLYFYPKDDTPGCTTEACGFRDTYAQFERAQAVVLGISPDEEASHQRFAAKFRLPFTLLCDPTHAVALAYGAWGEKKRYGRVFIGLLRKTFLIAPDGTLARVWNSVKTEGHAERVLEALQEHAGVSVRPSSPAKSSKTASKKSAPKKRASPAPKRTPKKRA